MSSPTANKNAAAAAVATDQNNATSAPDRPRPDIDLSAGPSGWLSASTGDERPPTIEQRSSLPKHDSAPGHSEPLRFTAGPVRYADRLAKRLFDLAVATAALVVAAPLLVAIAFAVKATSRGPILYGSPRLASGKPTFVAWKFRSMHQNADDRLAELLAGDSAARTEYELYRKLADDPRLTRLGRLLRLTSLDELPQLINIVKGEMSVVGPRPKLLNETEYYGEQLPLVLSIKPGLTGLWQISGRSKLTVAERVALDVKYVQERTFKGDLRICAITAGQLLQPRRHGAT